MLQIPDRKSQVVARVKAQRKAFLILIRKMFAVCGLRRQRIPRRGLVNRGLSLAGSGSSH